MSVTTNEYTNGSHTVMATEARFEKRLKARGFKLASSVAVDEETGKSELLGNKSKAQPKQTKSKAAK